MASSDQVLINQFKFTESRSIVILSILYVVGICGIKIPIHPDFILLTPINLLVSAAIVSYFDKNKTQDFLTLFTIVFLTGYLVEVIGVKTGVIFGSYAYGPVLGPKLFETPLSMGINWFILIYGAGNLMNQLSPQWPIALKACIGAFAMIVLDFLIEPVAIHYNFWRWENDVIPVQNYIAWWIISVALLMVFFKILGKKTNKVAIALLVLQLIFFGILNI